jgi:hypothetical protein
MPEKKLGSDTNDEMKYVRNNLYGYGYMEQNYISPTKNLNEIETDINIINEVNDAQTLEIDELKRLVAELVIQGLTKAEADTLYGASLNYDEGTSTLSLINGDGVALSDVIINSSASGGIISIEFVREDDHGNVGFFLKFVYDAVLPDGSHEIVTKYVDIGDLSELYVAGNGIEISEDATISLKINGDSDFVTLDENGLSFSGLNESLSDIIAKVGAVSPGSGLVVTNQGEAAFGNYNISTEGETLFSIGNGISPEERSNALEVKKDGSVFIMVEGEMMNINQLLGQIAHEIY